MKEPGKQAGPKVRHSSFSPTLPNLVFHRLALFILHDSPVRKQAKAGCKKNPLRGNGLGMNSGPAHAWVGVLPPTSKMSTWPFAWNCAFGARLLGSQRTNELIEDLFWPYTTSVRRPWRCRGGDIRIARWGAWLKYAEKSLWLGRE